jgi:hypothetical protein
VHEKWPIKRIAETSALDEEIVVELLEKGRKSTIAWNEAFDVLVDLDETPVIIVGMAHLGLPEEKPKDTKGSKDDAKDDVKTPERRETKDASPGGSGGPLGKSMVNGHSAMAREEARQIRRSGGEEEDWSPSRPRVHTPSSVEMSVKLADRLNAVDGVQDVDASPIKKKKKGFFGKFIKRFRKPAEEEEKKKSTPIPSEMESSRRSMRGSGGRWMNKKNDASQVPIEFDTDMLMSHPDGCEYRLEVLAGNIQAVLHVEVLAKLVHS